MKTGEFHWTDGWYFSRNEDGSVHIRKEYDGYTEKRELRADIPAAEWASICCSVSKNGETSERWADFQRWHSGDSTEELRTSQAKRVMPIIGPLLDAWEMLFNDIKGEIEEHSMLGEYLSKIHRAMEGTPE